MKRIFKYPLGINCKQSILLPKLAKPLCVREQHGVLCLWAEVEDTAPLVPREIRIVATGDFVVPGMGDYVGTGFMEGGQFVWHVYMWPEST